MTDDPFAAESDADETTVPITEGATVVAVSHHPVYGAMYRCRTWMAHFPWMFDRRALVKVYRGDPSDSPEPIGETAIVRLRRSGIEIRRVDVGLGSGTDEVEIDIVLEPAVEIQVGDTLAFTPRIDGRPTHL